MGKIKRKDLSKYSRKELENIILNSFNVIEHFNIIPDLANDDFQFCIDGKTYNVQSLVFMWNMKDDKSICDFCDYKKMKKELNYFNITELRYFYDKYVTTKTWELFNEWKDGMIKEGDIKKYGKNIYIMSVEAYSRYKNGGD